MKDIDIKLVERCITEKWDLIASGCKHVSYMLKSCPLCDVYYTPFNDIFGYELQCRECPIMKLTGEQHCRQTPLSKCLPGADLRWSSKNCQIVEEEIEFLIRLLPEDHPWRNDES